MKKLLTVITCLLLSACAYNPEYRFNEIRVFNDSSEPLDQVTIRDQNSGREFNCGDLPGFGYCQHRLPKPRFQNQPLDVSWTSAGEAKNQSVVPELKGPYSLGLALQAELHFEQDGSLRGVFKQEASTIQ